MPAGDTQIVLLYSTFETTADAEACGRALVERRLVACVNILPAMVSIYEWQGALERAEECVLIAKTRAANAPAARAALEEMHPYDTPAVLTLPTLAVNAAYRDWLLEQTDRAE